MHKTMTAAALLLALGLSACQETTTAARQPTVAPGVPIAVESISGAPETLKGSFTSALSSEASARQVDIVDPATKPRYRVRGYLAAQPTEDGQTALAFVWDVFDEKNKRAQRVQGATLGRKPGAADAWSGVDQTTVGKAASESMDAIAQFLVGRDSVQQAGLAETPRGGAVERAATASAGAPAATASGLSLRP